MCQLYTNCRGVKFFVVTYVPIVRPVSLRTDFVLYMCHLYAKCRGVQIFVVTYMPTVRQMSWRTDFVIYIIIFKPEHFLKRM